MCVYVPGEPPLRTKPEITTDGSSKGGSSRAAPSWRPQFASLCLVQAPDAAEGDGSGTTGTGRHVRDTPGNNRRSQAPSSAVRSDFGCPLDDRVANMDDLGQDPPWGPPRAAGTAILGFPKSSCAILAMFCPTPNKERVLLDMNKPLLGRSWAKHGQDCTTQCGESENRGPSGPRRRSGPGSSIFSRPDASSTGPSKRSPRGGRS